MDVILRARAVHTPSSRQIPLRQAQGRLSRSCHEPRTDVMAAQNDRIESAMEASQLLKVSLEGTVG